MRQRRKKRGTRMTRRTDMRGQRRLEKRSTDPTRTRSETRMSPMGMRMLIRTPSGAVEVLIRKNGRAAEAMGTREKFSLRWRRHRRLHRRKRYMRRLQSRRGAGNRTSRRRQRIFLPYPKIYTDKAVTGGTCMGMLYRCDDGGQCMEGK